MKAYLVAPPFEPYGKEDERTSQSIQLIAEIVFKSLRANGDTFQFAVDWADPGDEPAGIFTEGVTVPHVTQLHSDQALLDRLVRSIDPNSGFLGGTVRSIATCRCVAFGYDGQALLCLRHEDEPPISPDAHLAVIEERPDFLSECDYFDGYVHGGTQSAATH